MSYTKGPWIADSRHAVRVNGRKVAECNVWGPSWAEKKANARLCESAPELLDALEYCEDLLMRYEINRIDGEELSDSALIKIRAAIAKAKGEVR